MVACLNYHLPFVHGLLQYTPETALPTSPN
jgi:hypothetical protein